MFSYDELHDVYDSVNFDNGSDVSAYVNVKDEKIVVLMPDEFCEPGEHKKAERALKKGEWIEFPRKRDLELGKTLVFRFAEEHFPVNEQRFIAGMFSRSGAYGNWHDFLECKGLLNEWHQFENSEEERALKKWLAEMGIPFCDKDDKTK